MRPFLKEETGVGVYLRNLLHALSQIDQENEYFLFSASLKDRFPRSKIPPFSEKRLLDLPLPVKIMNFFWHRLSWPPLDYFFCQRLDLTHSPSPLILPTGGKKIVTVHDLFFMDFPDLVSKETRKDFVRKISDSMRKADGVIAVSRFTRDQILKRWPVRENRVRVIYHALDRRFQTDIPSRSFRMLREKLSLPASFILFVGGVEPRKNLLNLVEALKIIHSRQGRVPLVIAGRKEASYTRKLEEKIDECRLGPFVKLIGYLPAEELNGIYQLATVFVFPSLCEGFGLPLLEAMASGLPIAASRSSAIPEVAQDAALYFLPEEPEDIADKIFILLENKAVRQRLIERGRKRILDFDWKRTAEETLGFYQAVVDRG
ncbi:MAG: glycosyltransferase family 4 protein [Candidatus Aminicenantales bacterium]